MQASFAAAPLLQKKTRASPSPDASFVQSIGEEDLLLVEEQVGDVDEAPGLLGDGARELRMRVPERTGRDAGGEIEHLAPRDVPHATAFAATQDDRRLGDSSA